MPSIATACTATVLLVATSAPHTHVVDVNARQSQKSVRAQNAADAKLRADVHPHVSSAPADLTIQALVKPEAENRALEFEIDSSDFYRSSMIELSGAYAARLHTVAFHAIPAGTYHVRVAVIAAGGDVRATFYDRVFVVE